MLWCFPVLEDGDAGYDFGGDNHYPGEPEVHAHGEGGGLVYVFHCLADITSVNGFVACHFSDGLELDVDSQSKTCQSFALLDELRGSSRD